VVFPPGTVTVMVTRGTLSPDRPGPRCCCARAGALLCALLIVSALAACSRGDEPESIARSFVEQYYVRPDLPKAKTLADGLARRKIEAQEQLLQGVARSDGAADRSVVYSLYMTRKVGEDRIYFVYDLAISVDRSAMKKRAFISTTRVKDGWRVTNFQDEDLSSDGRDPR